eukprot:scaffold42891_cov68-Phaeocystis_antarctica.AAC.1
MRTPAASTALRQKIPQGKSAPRSRRPGCRSLRPQHGNASRHCMAQSAIRCGAQTTQPVAAARPKHAEQDNCTTCPLGSSVRKRDVTLETPPPTNQPG